MDEAHTEAPAAPPPPELPLAFQVAMAVPVFAVVLWFILRWWPRSEEPGD